MTLEQFTSELKNKGLKYTRHQAMSGSQYWTIEGLSYRISDHYNPNTPDWANNRTEACSFEQILNRIESDIESENQKNESQEWIYDEETDGFYKNPNFKK